jgi:PD-(D/E)XK nuclease superfamily
MDPEEGIAKNLYIDETYLNSVCRIPLDSLLHSVEHFISPELMQHLTPKFKPCPEAMTPFLCDLAVESCPSKGYYAKKNHHPQDDYIICVDKPHLYYLNGNCQDVISTTTFTHAFFPEFDDVKVATDMLNSKSFKETSHRPSHKYNGCKSVQDILDRWSYWAYLGTLLHANIENFINGDPNEIHPENIIPFQQFQSFLADTDFVTWEPYRTEWAIFDNEIRLSGKVDYVGIKPNGKLVIIDWKRVLDIGDSSFGAFQGNPEHGLYCCKDIQNCKFITYSLQTNIYKWIIEKNYGKKVESMYLIQFHPKNKQFVLHRCCDMQSYVAKMAACRKLALMQQNNQ